MEAQDETVGRMDTGTDTIDIREGVLGNGGLHGRSVPHHHRGTLDLRGCRGAGDGCWCDCKFCTSEDKTEKWQPMRMPPELTLIIAAMDQYGYQVFKNHQGYDLNIVGIRTEDDVSDTFNDWVTVFYCFAGMWNYFPFPATTDPGTFYRENPVNVEGTAVMKPGQYRGAYKVGYHKGYPALQQQGKITVWRDNNRDEVIDTTGSEQDTGIFALNIHRADKYNPTVRVSKWSAGCQVLQDPEHFEFLLKLCRRSRNLYGMSFTYTLLEEQYV